MTELQSAAPPVMAWQWDRLAAPAGYQAEIVRGEVVVTPSAGFVHNWILPQMLRLLQDAAPRGYAAVTGMEWRFDWRGAVAMAPVPDVMVVDYASWSEGTFSTPLLAVEILSPSDHRHRLANGMTLREGKLADYAEHGLADYLELDVAAAAVTARRYELTGGTLVEVDRAAGDAVLRADRPFRYAIRPAVLIGPPA
jgi:Uma2 family endonuclease